MSGFQVSMESHGSVWQQMQPMTSGFKDLKMYPLVFSSPVPVGILLLPQSGQGMLGTPGFAQDSRGS